MNTRKRTDAQIFVLCYKPVEYNIPDNSLYTPLLCGASVSKHKDLYPLKDNTGDNISERNQFYAEATGTYWIWKNMCDKYKYIGQTQYRRQLLLEENIDMNTLLKNYEAVLPNPLHFKESEGATVYGQYSNHHNSKDLDIAKSIISKKFPSYLPNFDKYIVNGNKLYANAGIILRSEDFARYCNFLFTIIDEHRRISNIGTVDDMRRYIRTKFPKNRQNIERQKFLYGFLAERLMTLFVFHNFKNILELPYVKYEGV